MKQMTLPSRVAIAALRKCVADAGLVEEKLATELRIVRRFKREATTALKRALSMRHGGSIVFTTGGKRRKGG